MRLWETIKNQLNIGLKKQYPAVQQQIKYQSAVYPDASAADSINKYMNNADVFAIVSKSAKKFASIPRFVYSTESKERAEGNVKVKELERLLNRPNPSTGQDSFLREVLTSYLTTGEVFIWMNKGDTTDINGAPLDDESIAMLPTLQMHVLPQQFMMLQVAQDSFWEVECYYLNLGNKMWKIPASSILHWKTVNMKFNAQSFDHLRGFSPLTAGKKVYQKNEDATDATVAMYQNGGTRQIIYNSDLIDLTPEMEAKIHNAVDTRINNKSMKGAVAALQGTWGNIDLGLSSVDMQLLEGKVQSMKELCALFDMPYELFETATSYNNKKEAKLDWIYDTIIPLSKEFDDELNRVLLKGFGLENSVYIASDPSPLHDLSKDGLLVAQTLSYAKGELTKNEMRKAKGEEPINHPWYDEVWHVYNGNELPLSVIEQMLAQNALEAEFINANNQLQQGLLGNE